MPVASRPLSFPKVGDVALMGRKPLVRMGQFAARGRTGRFSHAAISLGDRCYIDSLTNGGVDIRQWADLDEDLPIAVYRYGAAGNLNDRIQPMLDHYGRGYNFAFGWKGRWPFSKRYAEALFCSEFVEKVFTRSELGLERHNRAVLPIDLESLAVNPDWEDVTQLYKPVISGATEPTDGADLETQMRTIGAMNVVIRRQTAANARMMAHVEILQAMLETYADQYRSAAIPAPPPVGAGTTLWRRLLRKRQP